jgi:hypothetical protein
MGPTEFLAAVTAFYQRLATHASSRQVFLAHHPFTLPQPQKVRSFRNVRFGSN